MSGDAIVCTVMAVLSMWSWLGSAFHAFRAGEAAQRATGPETNVTARDQTASGNELPDTTSSKSESTRGKAHTRK